MDNPGFLVQVLQRLCNLGDDMTREVLAEISQADNLVEQLATRAELEDDVVVLACFGKFDELDDVWMFELSHNLYFFEDVGSLFETVSTIRLDMVEGSEVRMAGAHYKEKSRAPPLSLVASSRSRDVICCRPMISNVGVRSIVSVFVDTIKSKTVSSVAP